MYLKICFNPVGFFFLLLLNFLLFACSPADKTEASNLALLEKVYEKGINSQDLEVMQSSLAEDYVRHCQSMPPELQLITGRDSMINFIREHFKAFPDWKEEIDIKAVDGDIIAYTSRGTGTHTGPMMGIPATNKSVDLDHIIIQRFENGYIVETWVLWDNLAFLGQLGLMPSIEGDSIPVEN